MTKAESKKADELIDALYKLNTYLSTSKPSFYNKCFAKALICGIEQELLEMGLKPLSIENIH